MKKKVCIFLTTILLVVLFLSSKVFADLAPDPGPVEGAAPVILYAIGVGVVLIIAFLIIKSLGNRDTKK